MYLADTVTELSKHKICIFSFYSQFYSSNCFRLTPVFQIFFKKQTLSGLIKEIAGYSAHNTKQFMGFSISQYA